MDPASLPPLPQPTPQGDNSLSGTTFTPTSSPPVSGGPGAADPLQGQSAPVVDVKQQVVDRLKSANNVLVTVSSNPSVDQLASALGLTLMLDKLGKHATTVFSGEIPRAIEFLDPEATFEENVDSLRDFIIALDKEKADKLRYKVEDDFVRIFITPYKTTITEDDLEFSQGDFNVDVVVALGVTRREDLDKAITAHGRILHDATVITVNADGQTSSLGSIDWHSPQSSSIAQMLMSLQESFGNDLLDGQVATAYLTGVVAATNRFSNEKTTPQIMTLSAQLMAAGANQQLIASNLRQDGLLSDSVQNPSEDHEKESEVAIDHEEKDKKSSKKDESLKLKNKKEQDEDDQDDDLDLNDKSDEKPDDSPKGPPVDFPPKSDSNEKGDEDSSKSENNEEPVDLGLTEDLQQQLDEKGKKDDEPIEKEAEETAAQVVSEVKAGDIGSEPALATDLPKSSNDIPVFNSSMVDPKSKVAPVNPFSENKQDEVATSVSPQAASITPPMPSEPAEVSSNNGSVSDQLPTPSVTDATAENQPADNANAITSEQDEVDALAEARKAVESAAEAAPFNPANNPIAALNANPIAVNEPPSQQAGEDVAQVLDQPQENNDLPSIELPTQPTLPASEAPSATDTEDSSGEEQSPEPMDAFMSTHSAPTLAPPTNLAGDGGLPPLPPLPSTSAVQDSNVPDSLQNSPLGTNQPFSNPLADNSLPPLPGQTVPQPSIDPVAGFQPQTQPGFMQNMPISQNPLTQAADDLAATKADADQGRQAKMDEMSGQYDTAVDRNRELQGLPPLNNPNGSGMPPLPPAPTV